MHFLHSGLTSPIVISLLWNSNIMRWKCFWGSTLSWQIFSWKIQEIGLRVWNSKILCCFSYPCCFYCCCLKTTGSLNNKCDFWNGQDRTCYLLIAYCKFFFCIFQVRLAIFLKNYHCWTKIQDLTVLQNFWFQDRKYYH